MDTSLNKLINVPKYQKRLSQMNLPNLDIQKRYWEDLIYRYQAWKQPEKLRAAQQAHTLVVQEIEKRLTKPTN